MNFFKRTKTLFKIICIVDVIIGLGLIIRLLDGTLSDITLNPDNHILLLFFIGVFIVLSLIIVILKCIISDATEDLTSAFKLNNTTNKD